MAYKTQPNRYKKLEYKRCGKSGLLLPPVSLGLWHNFGDVDDFKTGRKIILKGFDSGITHFDLANNYGPPAGSAELNFGKILQKDLKKYRDELIISTKAGYWMWDGPYGEWGSRKYLLSSLDQSLKRMRLNYVDIFYSHRPDPNTPIEETMGALHHAVSQGKAVYAGISNYSPEDTEKAYKILKTLGTPLLIHQPKYSMLHREPEKGLLQTIQNTGIGCIVFSPLAQGLLTNKYLTDIPKNSRAEKKHGFLKKEAITKELRQKLNKLNSIAAGRGQSLAQMALSWLLNNKNVTSVLIGASSTEQLKDNLKSVKSTSFTSEELLLIDNVLK